jgi:cytoskeletal protein CcmA (bactofilin family)
MPERPGHEGLLGTKVEAATVIGEKTRIKGKLEGGEDVRVKGHVEGEIRLSETVFVEEGGVVVANLAVKVAIVSGVVLGNIEASERVHIAETARMVGDIAAPRVVLVDGASFCGHIDMGDTEAALAEATDRRSEATPRGASRSTK